MINQRNKALLSQQTEYLFTHIYAAFVCELWDMGWTEEQIQDLFNKTYERWLDSTKNGWDIVKNVKEVTGIDVGYQMREKRKI
jgi:hypothetical protein